MPAIVTHHLFGEDASALLPEDVLSSQEELLAFLLGNQGPDPLWARFSCLPRTASSCRAVARSMHEGAVVPTLLAMRSKALAQHSKRDAGIGLAFALGFAAHYLLDCVTHPLVLAQVEEICQCDVMLEGARAELHAIIEADIDSWVLWQKRQKTIEEAPVSSMLAITPAIDRVAGELVAHVAAQVHGVALGNQQFGRAVHDYRLLYRLIDPPSKRVSATLARLERLGRVHSCVEAHSHPVTTSDECVSANLRHLAWHSPATGEVSPASFADLFHDALLAWPVFAARLMDADQARLDAMVDDLNYYGMPEKVV